MPGGVYTTGPEQEVCQVKGPDCRTIPSQRLYCKTEGRGVLICEDDLKTWRNRVTSSSTDTFRLALRCPMCADWAPTGLRNTSPAPTVVTVTLQGSAAEAIDRAMHQEGLLVDVRQRILRRLANDAPWLADDLFVTP
jgi:hypothetical protein